MRRPQDPRNHGLKEPQKVIIKSDGFEFSLYNRDAVSLNEIINAWNRAIKDHEEQEHRITDGPFISHSYGDGLRVAFSYEFDNLKYDAEKAEYDATMAKYLEDLKLFKESEEKKKNAPPPGIDEQIVRAERRLANLKAVKAGQTIPFPEG